MKNARVRKRTTRRAARRQPAVLPVGLQMAVRFLYDQSAIVATVQDAYADADALARDIIAKGGGATTDDVIGKSMDLNHGSSYTAFRHDAMEGLTAYFAGHKDARHGGPSWPKLAAEEVVDGITDPPRAAGFRLGLCLGYRLAHAGKDGAR